MNIEQKLNVNKFVVDEGHPHIVFDSDKLDDEAKKILSVVCPAGLYTLNEKGQLAFEVAGCLECGTCRVALAHLPGAMVWNHPRTSFGVQFRCG